MDSYKLTPTASEVKASDGAAKTQKKRSRRNLLKYAYIWGWAISLILHLFLLAGFGKIEWTKYRELGSSEMEVSIGQGDQQEESIQLGTSHGLIATQPAMEISDSLTEPKLIEEIKGIEPEFSSEQFELSVPQKTSINSESTQSQQQWSDFAASSGSGQRGGGASFFGLEARGGKFVFVVDRSGSMGRNNSLPLKAAKAELLRTITEMDSRKDFYVIFYNDSSQPMPAKGLTKATEQNKLNSFEWIQSISAKGGTDPSDAMKKALQLKPDAIWLLSDGIFQKKAAETIRKENNDKGVRIHTIAFLSRDGEQLLKKIALENRGRYRFVPKINNTKP